MIGPISEQDAIDRLPGEVLVVRPEMAVGVEGLDGPLVAETGFESPSQRRLG